MGERLKLILVISSVIILFSIHSTYAEKIISDAGVEYDSSVSDKFDNGSNFVRVGITIRDNSGITVEAGTENVDEQLKQRNNWLENKSNEIIDSFSEEDFNLTESSRGIFVGDISRSGFEVLLNNVDVKSIVDQTGVSLQGFPLENPNNYTKIEPEEENPLSLWIWIIGGFLVVVITLGVIIHRGKS